MIPAAWSDALGRGYGVLWAVTIEGIRYVFSEVPRFRAGSDGVVLDITGAAPTEPSGYISTVPALAITDGLEVDCVADRQTGVATGRALDIQLSADALEAQGVLSSVFARPTLSTLLTVSEMTGTATTLTVASTTGFGSAGTGYLGLETFTWSTAPDPTAFTGVTRAVCGQPHAHPSDALRGFASVTDRPTKWKGRGVSLWAHLVSPEGRMLSSTWCTAGSYCVEAWAGTLDADPRPSAAGMTLRALPLIRKMAQGVGAEISGRVDLGALAIRDEGDAYIYATQADAMHIRVEYPIGTAVVDGWYPRDTGYLGYDTIRGWAQQAALELSTDLGASYEVNASVQDGAVVLIVWRTGGGSWWIDSRNTWFLEPRTWVGALNGPIRLRIDPGGGIDGLGWLPVRLDASEAWQVASISNSGSLRVDTGAGSEVVRWSEATQMSAEVSGAPDDVYLLHISERAQPGRRVNIWEDGATVAVMSGSQAVMAQALGELAQSSGLTSATRGTYDTLGLGYGLAIDEDRFDVAALSTYPWTSLEVDAAADSVESIEERLGGWLALAGQCLVQYTSDAGTVVIGPVSTVPTASLPGETIDSALALLDGHGAPETVDAPNEVKVERGLDLYTFARDVPRVVAEGSSQWEIRARGAPETYALSWAVGLIGISDGQAILRVEVPASFPARIGNAVTLTTAHPLAYDWANGQRGPTSASAIILGHAVNLSTLVQSLDLLLSGAALESVYLCPSAVVVSVDSSTAVTVTTGYGVYFAAGEDVIIYEPGNDTTGIVKRAIDTVSGDQLTFTAAHGASAGDVITYPALADASAAQALWAYRDDGTVWR